MRPAVTERVRAGLPSAGLWSGPLAWIVSMQPKYSLVPWICANQVPLIHPVTLVSVLISLGGGYLSWRAWAARPAAPMGSSAGGRPHSFVAGLGALSAVLFTLLILLQGAAGFVFDGCER